MPEQHPERLDLEQFSVVPLYNTKAVVQQTGIAAPTLRAWERRYLIFSPKRAQNDYRLYSERDIRVLRWLKERVEGGMSISQTIALFRHLAEGQKESDTQNEEGLSLEVQQSGSLTTLHMRSMQNRLLDAFNELDEATASQLMASMLGIYPIEHVCIELMRPTLWEIGQRWVQGAITVTTEHFATTFFHGILTNLLHATPPNHTSPLVIVCCAPGEVHELAPLMVALLLRRAGLHVVYLGQSIETASLVQTARCLSPALICVSATLLSSLETVTELSQKVQELPPPRPLLVFGGQAFEQHADLIARVSSTSISGDMQTMVAQLRHMALKRVTSNSGPNL